MYMAYSLAHIFKAIISNIVDFFMQIFLLQGRFIFGPDVRSLALTVVLIAVPMAVFCVFVARKLMDDFSHHLGVSIMVIAVAFTLYVSTGFSMVRFCYTTCPFGCLLNF